MAMTVYSARKCCLILADLALEVDAMTRFPFQRRCPDRLAQSYDYLCVVLAATARALRCMHACTVTACMHALSLHGNFTHACMHCVTAYRLWQLTIFFLLFLLQTDFFWHLIVWITFDHHYFWILSMEFSNNSTFAEKSWFLGNFPFTCVQSACSASGALAAHVCLNVRWMGILRVATAWYACTVTARKFHSRMHCVTAVLGSYYHA